MKNYFKIFDINYKYDFIILKQEEYVNKILDKFTSNAEYKVVSKKTHVDSGIYHTVYIDMEFVNINDENDVVKVEISSNHNSIFGEFNDLVVGTTFKVNWK